MENKEPILKIKNLTIKFGKGKNSFIAVDDVSFNIYRGETFGLVGESGSGKSTIGRGIIGLNDIADGEIIFDGKLISGNRGKKLNKEITKDIQMIFQDPMASLNERAKVDYIVSEGLYNLKNYSTEEERKKKVEAALLDVGLLPEYASRFPHEFSGGQRQRIGIARALIMEPKFIIADEPISALDVSIRAQVLNLLLELQKKKGLTYLFIAHDLSIVRFIADRVGVIHRGKIVEIAETEELFKNPLHPYTRSLLSAIPIPNPVKGKNKVLRPYKIEDIENRRKMEFIELRPRHYVLIERNE